MARRTPPGTPARSSRIIFPGGDRQQLWWSVAGAIALVLTMSALYGLGVERTVSPGDLASAHSHIDAACSQCHTKGENVADARCARCHDESAVGRMEHASHVLFGSGDTVAASEAPTLACASCHTDHRGQGFELRTVDDRQCAGCHREQFNAPLHLSPLTSFKNHPEFAAFKAQRTPGIGLHFDHVNHFKYVVDEKRGVEVTREEGRTAALDTCQRCHLLNRESGEFAAVKFEPGCSGSACHLDKGLLNRFSRAAEEVSLMHLVLNVPGVSTPVEIKQDEETSNFEGLKHRDPWVLFNAAWLRTSLDPVGAAAEREALRGSIAWLERAVSTAVFEGVTLETLQAWQNSLIKDVAELKERLAKGGQSSEDPSGFGRITSEIQTILKQVMTASGQTGKAPEVEQLSKLLIDKLPSDERSDERFNERRQELMTLVQQIEQRARMAGNAALAKQAVALKERVAALAPSSGGLPDLNALTRFLDDLNEVSRLGRVIPDPQFQTDLQSMRDLRDYARTQGFGTVDALKFEERRQEILQLLDMLAKTAGADLQKKIQDLRSRVSIVQPAGLADDRQRFRDRQRLLDRTGIEIDLFSSRNPSTRPSPQRGGVLTQQLLAELRPQLDVLERAGSARPALATERDAKRNSLNSLLKPCLRCHLFDGEDEAAAYPVNEKSQDKELIRVTSPAPNRLGLKLASVGAAQPVMTRARFNHRPHLEAATCAQCHSTVISGSRGGPEQFGNRVFIGSTLASELNSPGVTNCQSCHKPGGRRQDCQTCHLYHPPSAERLFRGVWSSN